MSSPLPRRRRASDLAQRTSLHSLHHSTTVTLSWPLCCQKPCWCHWWLQGFAMDYWGPLFSSIPAQIKFIPHVVLYICAICLYPILAHVHHSHLIHLKTDWVKLNHRDKLGFFVIMGETFTAFEQPYLGIYIDLILKKTREKWNMHRIIQYRSSFNSNHKHSQSVDLWDHLSFQLTVSAALVALGLPVWTSVDPWSQSFHLENQTSRW